MTARPSGPGLRSLVGAGVLAAVAVGAGTGPFVHGVGSLDPRSLALASAVAVVTTVACAWRWHLVAAGLGVAVPMATAVASCYRAQLLNTVLPGGALGDVHRGVRHGRVVGDTGRALRAVAWERLAGQVVHLAFAAAVLTALPSTWRQLLPSEPGASPAVACALLTGVVGLAAVVASGRGGRRRDGAPGRVGRMLRTVRDDVRDGLLVRRAWPGVVLASVVATVGHVATFVLAARAVGVTTPLLTLLPLAFLVLVAAGLPLNLAGWGPREGMAAWAFAASGLGATAGVATAVAYGGLVLVANAPGVALLLAGGRDG